MCNHRYGCIKMPTTRHDIGYHGTLDIKANAIIEQNYFIPSSKDTEWLGEGVYFFAHKQHAIDWANREASKPRNIGKASCVLSVDLDYEPSDLLDLDDPEQLQMLNDFVSASMEKLKSSKSAPVVNLSSAAKHQRWCFACNSYRRLNSSIKLTSYTFHFGMTLLGLHQNQRQICVNNPTVISNIRKETL